MKFQIHRASAHKGQPVPEAKCEKMSPNYEEWTIEIETLAELMALIEREGSLVVTAESIWIYDDYME